MDAPPHASRKDDKKQAGDKERYEGGRDSDQNRQAPNRGQRDEDKPATSEPNPSGGKGRRGTEEE